MRFWLSSPSVLLDIVKCCYVGDLKTFQKLLDDVDVKSVDMNATVNSIIRCQTVLTACIQRGDVWFLRELLGHRGRRAGFDIFKHLTDNRGMTPLMFACLHNDVEIVQELVTFFESDHARAHLEHIGKSQEWFFSTTTLDDGMSAAHYTVYDHNKSSIECMRVIANCKFVDKKVKNKRGHTPLHFAAARTQHDLIREWLSSCTDKEKEFLLYQRDTDGMTPLHSAVASNRQYHGGIETVKLLISFNSDVSVTIAKS